MADDSWKGEHLIRAATTDKQTKAEVRRLNNKIAHAKRRKAGIPAAGAKKHAALVKTAIYDTQRGGGRA